MKLIKFLTSVLLAAILIIISCGNDDDAMPDANTEELLTSGRWYIEAISDEPSRNDCDKNTNWQFKSGGTLTSEVYSDVSDTCQLFYISNHSWELLSDKDLRINTDESEAHLITIETISKNDLVLRSKTGEKSMTFDKNPGNE